VSKNFKKFVFDHYFHKITKFSTPKGPMPVLTRRAAVDTSYSVQWDECFPKGKEKEVKLFHLKTEEPTLAIWH
jgi:hypothetical protein